MVKGFDFVFAHGAWLVQLVRSLPSDHKASSLISAQPKFESLCDLFFHLS